MNWYIARIVFQIICGPGDHTPQFDEQLRLINAEDEMHAFNKARLLGEKEEDHFYNDAQLPVCWKFIDVVSLQQFHIEDGSELDSRIFEEESAKNYLLFIQAKSKQLYEAYVGKMCILQTE